ncbi:MAG: hypothetical protein P4L53_05760, partial [Candidatus Obscuribacterales bacterium]|nr:hypothetical protein [Candidatus Obscuribacterales bacterium]
HRFERLESVVARSRASYPERGRIFLIVESLSCAAPSPLASALQHGGTKAKLSVTMKVPLWN